MPRCYAGVDLPCYHYVREREKERARESERDDTDERVFPNRPPVHNRLSAFVPCHEPGRLLVSHVQW